MPTTQQKESLASNCTFVTESPLIKLTATDGTVAAYVPHTRYLTINGTLYSSYYPFDAAQPDLAVGLQPDSMEFKAPFDDIITKPDVVPGGGKWSGGRAYTAYVVDYRNPSLGVVQERHWLIGKVRPKGTMFTMELLGRTQALRQQIGESTSPIDRNRTPEELGVNMASFTHAATVTAVTDRRIFTVNVNQADVGDIPYFMYGRCIWLTGENAGLEMEIETNAGPLITLQLPMRSDVDVDDTCQLIAGYDGTREQARLKFNAVEKMNAETDLPGLNRVLTYPE